MKQMEQTKKMEQAKNIIRHSIVKHDNKMYMIETKHSKNSVLLIPASGTGKEVKSTSMLEVVAYPAQLAIQFLQSKNQ